MKDGWHKVYGEDVYVEDGKVLRGHDRVRIYIPNDISVQMDRRRIYARYRDHG